MCDVFFFVAANHGARFGRGNGRHFAERWSSSYADLACDAVDAINELFCGADHVEVTGVPIVCQANACANVLEQSARMCHNFDASLSDRCCFNSMTGGLDYRCEPTSFVNLDEKLLSLPTVAAEPRDFRVLMGPSGPSYVKDFLSCQILSNESAAGSLAACGIQKPFMDSGLRKSTRRYHSFLRRLWNLNLIDVSFVRVAEVGVFAVSKKGGRQRMVLDCRLANCWFGSPARCDLPTSASFTKLELGSGDELSMSQFDLLNAFYQLGLPIELRPYFCLPEASAICFGISPLEGYQLGPGDLVVPRLRVVSIGWSHALNWCQDPFKNIILTAVPTIPLLTDMAPAPDLAEGCATLYVDNSAALATDPDKSSRFSKLVCNRYRLSTHEHCDSLDDSDLLGLHFARDGLITPKGDRRWKLQGAIAFALRCGSLTSRQLHVIVGVFTFQCMLRRELLSLLRATYCFINKEYANPHRPWPAVRRELSWMQRLLPMLTCDVRRHWSSEVLMYDASPWGVGICRAHALPDVVASVGRYSERWRFKNHENVSMRVLAHRAVVQHVFQESGAEAAEQLRVRILSGKKFLLSGIDPADLNEDSFIPMVPRVLGSYLGANWRTCVSSPWSRREHITVLETRACVAALTLVFRKLRHHHRRLLFLSDSVASILGAGNGRSSRPGMCRALRQVCALVLCTGIVLNVRWIPSELDDADRPSRRGLSMPWPPHGGFSGCFPQDRPRRARTRRSVEPAAGGHCRSPRSPMRQLGLSSATYEMPSRSKRRTVFGAGPGSATPSVSWDWSVLQS